MREIRKRAKTEEIDYLFLMDCLSNYKHPRNKLTSLLKNTDLIRVKKGLYVFGEEYRRRPYSLEVDTNPPPDDATTTSALLLLPYPFSVKTLRLEDLFAGKVHATLCREWKGRVKGRDWYDFVWFVSRGISLNLNYLEQRMRQSGYWVAEKKLTYSYLLDCFDKKIRNLDIDSAKADSINFIKDSSQLTMWSHDFFRQIARKINTIAS